MPQQPDRYTALGECLIALDKLAGDASQREPGQEQLLQEFVPQPFERRRLDLEIDVPDRAQPGTYIVIHLAQNAEALVVGGYSIVVRVVAHV